jgi:energy-coupling factor transporter ATP-binding protein EcfA2
MEKQIGILCHVTSIPSEFGIGDFGVSSKNFLDALADNNINIWQILPLNITNKFNCPYSSFCYFSYDEMLVGLETFLSSGVITEEDVKEACDYVNASHFINKLENGLDDEVLERGNNFSSGQRQLLSFARTIAHKPEVMILDEATANIDTETEKLIQDSLEKMMNVGTMLIVAHRLSTIQHADKIIVLSHGEILEQGNHQELLKKKGHYYNLYNIQLDKDKYSK